jgi:oligoendopeptidase F
MSDLSHLPKWNLTDLYPSTDSEILKNDLARLTEIVSQFAKYRGKLEQMSAEDLLKVIQEYEEISDLSGRIGSFAFLNYSTAVTDTKASSFYQNTTEKLNELSTQLIFFTLELNKLEEPTLKALFTRNSELAGYAPFFRDVRVFREYQLSEPEEQILREKSVTCAHAWNRLFDDTLARLEFNLNGEKLSFNVIAEKMTSHNPTIRAAAGKELGRVLGNNIKLFAMITNTLAKDKQIEDQKRGFKRPISSRNLANLIEDEVVETLIGTVKQNYAQLSHRYYKLKAKWMGVESLNYWDRNAPIPGEEDRTISWEEAVDTVMNAYRAFSPEIGKIAQQFFDNNWIDVPTSASKRTGAFAHPTVPSCHPYLLLNYQGQLRDVMTLAHELGHGVHQVLAAKQGALMCDTPLTLAETASVFGEQMTFRALLNQQSSPTQRKVMLASKVEDMLNTVVRQIAFCEFEGLVHDQRRQGELSEEDICNIWMKVQSESLGSGINLNSGEGEYKYFWAYIPHFIHTPFYVYAYAFGDCLVNALYGVYMDRSVPEFEAKYLEMLSQGGTLRHKELLAPFGLDASKPDFWQRGLDVISGFINELEKM